MELDSLKSKSYGQQPFVEGISHRLDAPLNEEYEIFEEMWPRSENKKKAAIGPRKKVSQENQDQILALKFEKERGRVVGKLCMADTASVVLDNSKSKDERKKLKH